MRAIIHIDSLEAHTTLNTYNLWKLASRGQLCTDGHQRGIELGTFCPRERCLNRSATSGLREITPYNRPNDAKQNPKTPTYYIKGTGEIFK